MRVQSQHESPIKSPPPPSELRILSPDPSDGFDAGKPSLFFPEHRPREFLTYCLANVGPFQGICKKAGSVLVVS